MKKILSARGRILARAGLFLSFSVCTLLSSAQKSERISLDEETFRKEFGHCGTMENLDRLKKEKPGYAEQRLAYEQQIQNFLAAHPTGRLNSTANMAITIPTVVHVVWNTSAENISDNTVINSVIGVLNEDYGRTNADASQTPSVWQSIAANTGIQFCLAQRDPSGNPTNGIVRVQTSQTSFTTDDKVKFTAQGGDDAWPTTQYFNIWVCDLGGGLGGYGEFPGGSPSNTFGNVSDYQLVGGFVVSHESGHCFNLYHIWGDDGTACTGSDACADTPNQSGPTNANCATFPMTDACSPSSPGVMFMNYMDYTYQCTNLFTQNQSSRANAVLNTAPYNALATSLGCVPVNLVANDGGISTISTPNGLICGTTFSPSVTLKNWGSNTLTSCTINYQVDANPVQQYSWSGNLASLATVAVTLPSLTTTAGTHSFTCYTSNPNSTSDGNPGNDQSVSTFSSGVSALPVMEGFQSSTSAPTGWTIVDGSSDGYMWIISTSVGGFGNSSQCIAFDNCNPSTDITGRKDRFNTVIYDFSSATSAQMTFDVASTYLIYQSQTYADTLAVYYSTDCGNSWTQCYIKGGAALATAPNLTSAAPTCFVPTATQWRTETINLNNLAGQPAVMFAFENISDWAEWMYVDNINISAVTGIHEVDLQNAVSVYPNPSGGEIYVSVNTSDLGVASFNVRNTLGEIISTASSLINAPKEIRIDLSGNAGGIYFMEIKTEKGSVIKKIVLEK